MWKKLSLSKRSDKSISPGHQVWSCPLILLGDDMCYNSSNHTNSETIVLFALNIGIPQAGDTVIMLKYPIMVVSSETIDTVLFSQF